MHKMSPARGNQTPYGIMWAGSLQYFVYLGGALCKQLAYIQCTHCVHDVECGVITHLHNYTIVTMKYKCMPESEY